MTWKLSPEAVMEIHAFLAKEFGGTGDVRDESGLRELVTTVMNTAEEGLFEAAAALMAALATRAPFAEKNVRTAFFAADVFLRMNGFYLRCDNVLTQRFFSALLEEGRFTRDNLHSWIKANTEKLNP